MEIRTLVGGTASVCGPDTTVSRAAQAMMKDGIGSIGVVDQGRLIGIFTERDALKVAAGGSDCATQVVSDWMTPDPDVLEPQVEVEDAAEWLLATGYRHLPVVENGVLLGIVSIKDILWALREPIGQGG